MNIPAIGAQIAVLCAAVSPPAGYQAIQVATSKRQKGAGKLPMVIVYWQGTRDLQYGFSRRSGVLDYTAVLYYSKAADIEAVDTGLQRWHDALVDALIGQLQLGEWDDPNGVQGAYTRTLTPGEDTLGGDSYATIEVAIEVPFEHAIPTASTYLVSEDEGEYLRKNTA